MNKKLPLSTNHLIASVRAGESFALFDFEGRASNQILNKVSGKEFKNTIYLDLGNINSLDLNILSYAEDTEYFFTIIQSIADFLFSHMTNNVYSYSVKEIFIRAAELITYSFDKHISLFHIPYVLENTNWQKELIGLLPNHSHLRFWFHNIFQKFTDHQKSEYILVIQSALGVYQSVDSELFLGKYHEEEKAENKLFHWCQKKCILIDFSRLSRDNNTAKLITYLFYKILMLEKKGVQMYYSSSDDINTLLGTNSINNMLGCEPIKITETGDINEAHVTNLKNLYALEAKSRPSPSDKKISFVFNPTKTAQNSIIGKIKQSPPAEDAGNNQGDKNNTSEVLSEDEIFRQNYPWLVTENPA